MVEIRSMCIKGSTRIDASCEMKQYIAPHKEINDQHLEPSWHLCVWGGFCGKSVSSPTSAFPCSNVSHISCCENLILPGRDFDSEVAVNCNSQEGQYWTLGQHQHGARHEQAAVKVSLESDADSDCQRDDEGSHCDIGQSQGYDETKRCISQRLINFHGPNHHHIPDYRRDCNHHLHWDVKRLRW